MSINSQDYHGLWRASANEGVPYSEDFPEPMLVLLELIDGALGDGNADKIDLLFDITNPDKCSLQVRDNGKGIKSETRLKSWTSKDHGTKKKEHVYGHGSKKMLTKWMPIYEIAKWRVLWRKQDKKGVSGVLNIMSSPFKGLETQHEEDEENEDICPEHGTQWEIEFNLDILGKLNTPKDIMASVKELLCIRYEPHYYEKKFEINIKIINGLNIIRENSKKWKSLKETLDDKIKLNNGSVSKIFEHTFQIDNTILKCDFYKILEDGRSFSLEGFNQFGKKNMNATRLHMGRYGRYIEAKKLSHFLNKEQHNSNNCFIGFIMFSGDELPTPCTTKVKFQEECPIYKKCAKNIIEQFDFNKLKNKLNPSPKLVEPKPKPVEPKPPAPVEPKPVVNLNTSDMKDYNVLEQLYTKYGEKWIIDNLEKIKKSVY